jgi:hypothetical protein
MKGPRGVAPSRWNYFREPGEDGPDRVSDDVLSASGAKMLGYRRGDFGRTGAAAKVLHGTVPRDHPVRALLGSSARQQTHY